MVELPPNPKDLNEYGKFAFLNEMHTMASQIVQYVKGDDQATALINSAIEAIEGERQTLRGSFRGNYTRPESKNVISLIMRCSELYLQSGIWYDMCRANIRLAADAKENENFLDDVRNCFNSPDLTERYVISSPIIELTLTRIEMMKFFESEQIELYKGPEPGQHEHLTNFEFSSDDSDDSADRFNKAEIDERYVDLDKLVLDDHDYLLARENQAWAVLREIRFLGSLACLIYYIIHIALIAYVCAVTRRRKSFSVCANLGTAIIMFMIEVVSLRTCLIACCRPDNPIECIYPGLELYVTEYVTAIFASIIMAIGCIVDREHLHTILLVLTIHHWVSLIWPLCTQFIFTKTYHRVERKFRWIRIKFFTTKWWTVYRVVSFILFTPSVPGIETILFSKLRNMPTVTKMAPQQLIDL
ncbi:hypothetical protein TVAG_224470 [Trichomonas vaginalis G3]|uniref:Uncharacterized protein n=1 Tax=Trichomonas vaginalis (strain ATCC PRA-98 / G3) TaxID=412133 RepID=A2DW70_TRIV3|nr:hypothetical protein TVAGG3_0804590 [Trichomonas vaginalis G3]EAY15371.1 hypothetical protein TVAG_224470 [Trichomonas vaginalis G3]KAI5496764.1 hypothetical protein TVAGG3_0804590 [Trichomonas vaginalis G3]|eukprot:XP_001327594.1 hypothetical protein [Trichomonas vaginalis G3]